MNYCSSSYSAVLVGLERAKRAGKEGTVVEVSKLTAKKQEELLRVRRAERKWCAGISGRTAKAAGPAPSPILRSEKEKRRREGRVQGRHRQQSGTKANRAALNASQRNLLLVPNSELQRKD